MFRITMLRQPSFRSSERVMAVTVGRDLRGAFVNASEFLEFTETTQLLLEASRVDSVKALAGRRDARLWD